MEFNAVNKSYGTEVIKLHYILLLRHSWYLYRALYPIEKMIISQEYRRVGCYAMWFLQEPTFRRNLAPLSSGWQESVN
jgi:hypothetical protein